MLFTFFKRLWCGSPDRQTQEEVKSYVRWEGFPLLHPFPLPSFYSLFYPSPSIFRLVHTPLLSCVLIMWLITSSLKRSLDTANGGWKSDKCVYDVAMQCDVLIFLCDNPRAAQVCSHLGSSTRKFCRICHVSKVYMIHVMIYFHLTFNEGCCNCWTPCTWKTYKS